MFFSFDVFGAVFQLPGGLVNDGTVVKGYTFIPIKEAKNNLVVFLLWLKNSYQKASAQEMMHLIEQTVEKENLV